MTRLCCWLRSWFGPAFTHRDWQYYRIERKLDTLIDKVTGMETDIEAIKADLAATKDNVAAIAAATADAARIEKEQADTISDLKGKLAGLTAGNEITDQELAELHSMADTLKSQSSDVLAALQTVPVPEPVVDPTDDSGFDDHPHID